jgi:hypothetical protein
MAGQSHSGIGDNINVETLIIENIPKLTSDLTTIVNILGKRLFLADGISDGSPSVPFNPESKILYNNIIKFKWIIDSYKSFVGKLSVIYSEFDKQGTNKTHIVLENIKLNYLKEKSTLLKQNKGKAEIEVIREFADDIIEAIERNLSQEIKTSTNIEISSESINLSLQIVLIDAFIRCKILEEPVQHAIT